MELGQSGCEWRREGVVLMRGSRLVLTVLVMAACSAMIASGVDESVYVSDVNRPVDKMQIIFRAKTGPFRVQKKETLDASQWQEVTNAVITEPRAGVFFAAVPVSGNTANIGYFRILSEADPSFELKGWSVVASASTPANGSYFVAGERPVVTVTIVDTLGQDFRTNDLSTLNLYLYGPQDPVKSITPCKLLNVSSNRSVTPHHYVNLLNNTNVQGNARVVSYTLQPVTDELPGTYTFGVVSKLAADPIQQIVRLFDVQIGTNVVETQVVAKRDASDNPKCASCHEGPDSGKIYLHHIDPRDAASFGSWAYDYEPVKSCKICHNNEGYAAYRDATSNRIPDHVVTRVHGLHMGDELTNKANTNEVNGIFLNYRHVKFPADVRNCTTCHLDDKWKTKPSRLACGTCHDNTWFGPTNAMPAGMVAHVGGAWAHDRSCGMCHPADGVIEDPVYPVAASHQIPTPPMGVVRITMSTPANGRYYVAGETPQATLVFFDDTGTNAIDHTLVTESNFLAANFYAYGPRARSIPVLTTVASVGNSNLTASISSRTDGPWDIDGKVLRIAINGSAPQDITIVRTNTFTNLVYASEVVAALNAVITNLNGGATATAASTNKKVTITTKVMGNNAKIAIYNGDVTTAMTLKQPGVTMEPDITIAAPNTQANDIRRRNVSSNNDPRVTRTPSNLVYQMSDVAGLPAGTYVAFCYTRAATGKVPGIQYVSSIGDCKFQIGTSTVEKKIATSCDACHGDTIMHLFVGQVHPAYFEPDQCKSCHDYKRWGTGSLYKNQGGTSTSGWSGYGSMPISRRVHGVHKAHYLEHPEEIYANATPATFGEIIFSVDVRNCTKCHSESTTWKEKAEKMACMACHDTDAGKAHGNLMTYTLDPTDPYSTTAVETCNLCHGKGKDFSADKVHNLKDPFVQPYVRE